MMIDLDLTEALAVLVAMADDAMFPRSASWEERAALRAEAMRVVTEHAKDAARRNVGSNNVERLGEAPLWQRCE
jgi:hypothetical protein